MLKCDVYELPQFGEIHDIFVSGNIKLFVINVLQTEYFECKLNAYCVSTTSEKCIIRINDLMLPHSLSGFRALGNNFVPLINHERVEFLG